MTDIFKRFRDSIHDLIRGSGNNIEKLMRDKVDDFHLIEEVPCPIIVGGELMFVGNLTLNNLYIFIDSCARIFATIGIQLTTFDVFTDSAELTKLLIANKRMRWEMKRLIKKTILNQQDYYIKEIGEDVFKKMKLSKVSWRHFKKNITLEKLIQILFLVYQFNFDAVKKNFKILAEKMDASQLLQTYIYSWLVNCPGLSGSFVTPQYQKLDSYVSAKRSEEPQSEEMTDG